MVESDFVFERGDPINVGNHGETDFVFSGGNKVVNSGTSDFIFEAGIGLGGRWLKNEYRDLEVTINTSINGVEARMEYENGERGNYAIIYLNLNPESGNGFDVTFKDVATEKSKAEDNMTVGLVADPENYNRTKAGATDDAFGFTVEEARTKESAVETFTPDGIHSKIDGEYPFPGPTDLRVEWDGSTATFYKNGNTIDTASTSTPSSNYFPYLHIEGEQGENYIQVGSIQR